MELIIKGQAFKLPEEHMQEYFAFVVFLIFFKLDVFFENVLIDKYFNNKGWGLLDDSVS